MQNPKHGGFSNPFGVSQNPYINQGQNQYMNQGFQSFAPPQHPKTQIQPKTQLQQQFQSMPNPKVSIRQSKIAASTDRQPNKRLFKGKYELNATIPVKYNTVDYFMLVENVRINNETALRELKRGKAADILNQVMDSLEFLSYVHK